MSSEDFASSANVNDVVIQLRAAFANVRSLALKELQQTSSTLSPDELDSAQRILTEKLDEYERNVMAKRLAVFAKEQQKAAAKASKRAEKANKKINKKQSSSSSSSKASSRANSTSSRGTAAAAATKTPSQRSRGAASRGAARMQQLDAKSKATDACSYAELQNVASLALPASGYHLNAPALQTLMRCVNAFQTLLGAEVRATDTPAVAAATASSMKPVAATQTDGRRGGGGARDDVDRSSVAAETVLHALAHLGYDDYARVGAAHVDGVRARVLAHAAKWVASGEREREIYGEAMDERTHGLMVEAALAANVRSLVVAATTKASPVPAAAMSSADADADAGTGVEALANAEARAILADTLPRAPRAPVAIGLFKAQCKRPAYADKTGVAAVGVELPTFSPDACVCGGGGDDDEDDGMSKSTTSSAVFVRVRGAPGCTCAKRRRVESHSRALTHLRDKGGVGAGYRQRRRHKGE
jgi:hypothetical protein